MRPRTIQALLGLFGLLLAGWLFLLWSNSRPRPRNLLWARAAQARRLVIGRPSDKVELTREGGAWRLLKPFAFPADEQLVEGLLEKLAQAELSEPLSENPERHELFMVTESSGIRLTGYGEDPGRPELDIWVGRSGADYDTFFFRSPDAPTVREARGLARYELDREPGRWADLVLCAIDQARILSVELSSPRETLRFRRKGGSWFAGEAKTPLPQDILEGKLQSLFTALERLSADAVLPESSLSAAELRGLKQPELRILVRAQGKEGETPETAFEFAAGAKGLDHNHLLRKQGLEGFVYRVAPWRLESFRRKASDFKPVPAKS